MPTYLIGIAIAFLSPILHGGSNVLDSYLSNKLFKRITTLVFFSSVLNVMFLPLLWFFGLPHLLSIKLIGVVAVISLIEVLYQFPYYWAFRKADASIVTSLFSFGEIIVPFLAFFLARERLAVHQYAGYFVVTICGSMLGFDPKRFRLNQAAWLMLGVSVMLALQTILYKFAYQHGADWTTVLTWSSLMQILFAMTLAFGMRAARQDVIRTGTEFRYFGLPVLIMQLLTWGGEASEAYSLTLIPASVVSGIGGAQPLFVLAIAALLVFKRPDLIREQLDSVSIWKKLLLLIFLGMGIILVVLN